MRGSKSSRANRLAASATVDRPALEHVLCEIGRVDRLEDLGANGPLLASAGTDSLFNCLFGRDSIRMAMDLLDDFPAVARATLIELARLQGTRDNARAEEEPGRILHEQRSPGDPHFARLSAVWDFPYYGSVDSTPQWINLLANYCERVASRRILESTPLLENLRAAVDWILRRLDDPRGGGYVWVQRSNPQGIRNQVWEDSRDSHFHEDGTLFDERHAYAPVAVQGYAYDALLSAADLLDWPFLKRRAAELRARTLAEFWQPDLGTFAQALTFDVAGQSRPARVVASSPGHLLASRLLDGPDAASIREQLAARLRQPDLLAAVGVRTKSTASPRFRAGSYHNGSVWPMDTGVIADGLRRHGYEAHAADLEHRVLRSCSYVGGFPEFFRGDDADIPSVNVETVNAIVDGVPNRLEQPPQANQGWTVTRVWRIVNS